MKEVDRTELLLALILLQNMKSASLTDKAHQLNLAGFTNLEIADVLQTKPQIVADSLYRVRRRGPAHRRKPKQKKR